MAASTAFNYVGEYDENEPLPKYLTLEQYRRVIFRPDAHFVDGEIVPRNLGDTIHGRIIGALVSALYTPCKSLGFDSCISLRLQSSPTRIRVCDFAVLRAHKQDAISTSTPLLCIEVLAPYQQPEAELKVLTDYLNMGVPNIWLIDPIRRSAFTFDAQGLHESDPTSLKIPNIPIHLDLTEAFAAID